MDDPAGSGGEVPCGGEDVVDALAVGVLGVGIHGTGVRLELLLVLLGPSPGVVDGVAGGSVDGEVELGGGHGAIACLFLGLVCGADGAIWVEDAPCIADRGEGGDDAVGEREGDHVEVSHGDDEVAFFCGAADVFGDVPCLGGAVA